MRIGAWQAVLFLAGLVILAAAPLPHVDSDAPLYSRIAENVLATGDWVTFHHPGWLVDKPPVVFWLMAASFRVLGINDTTIRLWQLLLVLALLAVTAAASRAAGGSRDEGLLAAIVLATSLQFYYQATVPQQDVPLTLFVSLGVYGAIRYMDRGGVGWVTLAAAAVALAVLTKGLAGAALFGAVVALAFPFVRRALPVPSARLLTHAAGGALIFAAIAVPWYAHGVLVHGEGFVRTFLTSGTLGIARFFRPAISTPPPYWLSLLAYVPLLLLGLLPWTPGFVVGLADLPPIMRRRSPGLKIVVAWLCGILIVLSLSSGDKVFRYLLPCYPPAAILTARALTAMLTDRRRLRIAAGIAILPAVALIGAGFWSLWAAFPPERGLLAAVVLPAVAMIAVGLVAFGACALAGRGRAAVAATALAALAGYALFERGMLVHAAAINPWPAMAEAAAPYAATSTRLVLYGRVGELFNFAHFYFDEPVVAVSATHELRALWGRERVLVIVPAERFGEIAALLPPPTIVTQSPARLLLLINWSPAGP